MKARDEKRAHELREELYTEALADRRKRLGRKRTPPQPARDDRGSDKPWRPGRSHG